jgi:glyoxylase-like metal-dependent hydrolase (beta-lactamase superfamily II)
MKASLSSASIDTFWRRLFPGQISERLLVADPLDGDELQIEGHKLVVVDAGRTDAAHSTCLHIPSIGLIVSGDVVYNGIHPYLSETDRQSRLEWIASLDKLKALNPRAVIAGHKIPENNDDPRIIEETQKYIQDFIDLDKTTTTPLQLYDAMLMRHPHRVNPGSLWSAANSAKKPAQPVFATVTTNT